MIEKVMGRAFRLAGTAALLAGLAVAAVWSARLGWSDYWFHRQTVPATEKAIRATPDQAMNYRLLAFLVADNDPGRSTQALERATALNPYDAQSWVELGLRREEAGDTAGAERDLLRGADVSRLYLPKWSLANFYVRHNQPAKFWIWASRAAALVYGDPTPLFRLCWHMADDADLIARKLDIRSPEVQAEYAAFLLSENRWDAAAAASQKLLRWDRAEDTPLLLSICGRLIGAHRPDAALNLWNELARTHRTVFEPLAPEAGRSLTNGDFAAPPSSQGFDWSLPGAAGIRASLNEHPPGLRLEFSGEQPESCEALAQFVPVQAGAHYRLTYSYRTEGIAPGTGLGWRVTDDKGAPVQAQSASLSAENAQQGEFSFKAPAAGRLVHLVLAYQRAPGTTRIEGYLILWNLKLSRVAQ